MNLQQPSYSSNRLGRSTFFKSLYDTTNLPYNQKYNNCQMNATAIYVVELVGCVAVAGPLGWSPIGPIIYLACIGTSTYQLYTSDRICKTDFKYCK